MASEGVDETRNIIQFTEINGNFGGEYTDIIGKYTDSMSSIRIVCGYYTVNALCCTE